MEGLVKDAPHSGLSPSSNSTVPESAAEAGSPEKTKDKQSRSEADFMRSEVFQALMEDLHEKKDNEQVRTSQSFTEAESSLPETELLYPENYESQMRAKLEEAESEHGDKDQFMDRVKGTFEAQKKMLFGEDYKQRGDTNLSAMEAELVKSLRTQLETMAGKASLNGQQAQSERTWEASDQVYVMGYDAVGRYIAFLLAGTKWLPPVRYMIHRINIWKEWQNCGRRIIVDRPTGLEAHDRVIAEFISMKADPPLPGPLIPNLIVTVPPGSVVRALEPIKHRLDQRSTICLIHNGLGAVEAIIKAHFPDERTRPAFIVGHMTTRLGKTPDMKGHFSVVEMKQGRLFLSLANTSRASLIRRHPPPEKTKRLTNLLNLLVLITDLNASGHPFADFMRHKLPTIALLSIAEPLAAICEVPYEDLLKHEGTKKLIEALLWEVCAVVSKMPEFRNAGLSQPASSLSLFMHKKFYNQLQSRKKSRPRIDIAVNRMWENDINYLTGYFIDRADELNVRVPNLKTTFAMLKAKRHFSADRILDAIPFEEDLLVPTNNAFSS